MGIKVMLMDQDSIMQSLEIWKSTWFLVKPLSGRVGHHIPASYTVGQLTHVVVLSIKT